jgi:hypothetical protein
MDFIAKTIFIFIIFIFGLLYQAQNHAWDETQQLMKNADNLSVHDALLQVVPEELANGRIIFDPTEARAQFNETLDDNLGLNKDNEPQLGSPMNHRVDVLDFIMIDDSNATFPFLYENTTYNVVKWLNGPAIFAVVRSRPPGLISIFNKLAYRDITIPAIEEYKLHR